MNSDHILFNLEILSIQRKKKICWEEKKFLKNWNSFERWLFNDVCVWKGESKQANS